MSIVARIPIPRVRALTGNVITACVLVEISATLRTRLRDLADERGRQFLVLDTALLGL